MNDWQMRAVVERDELDAKIKRLSAFLRSNCESVPWDDLVLMWQQRVAMVKYRDILDQRIARFAK